MAEKESKINTKALNSPSAWLGYGLIFYGVIAYIVKKIDPQFQKDIIFLAIIGGILGLISLIFVVINFFNYFGIERHKTMGMTIAIVITGMFILIFENFIIFQPIEGFSVDKRFSLSGFQFQKMDFAKGVDLVSRNERAHPAIVIVGIDNDTVDEYQGWPFSWKKYANLLYAMKGSKLNTIMFDIFFADNSKNNYGLRNLVKNIGDDILKSGKKNVNISESQIKKAKAYLSQAMKKSGKVVVDYSFETIEQDDAVAASVDYRKRIKNLNRFVISNVIPGAQMSSQEWVEHPEPPIPAIGKAIQGMGYANIRKESTGVNRSMPLVVKWKNRLYPGIDLVLAAHYYGLDIKKDIEVKLGEYVKLMNIPNKKIKIGVTGELSDIMVKPNEKREIIIPIDDEGFMEINFIGGPYSFHSNAFKFYELADNPTGTFGGDAAATFENQILMVAAYYATGVSKDIHGSPFGDMAGIEHHANALNTILQQDFIYYAPAWINYIILIIIGLFFGWIVPRYNIQVAMMSALGIAVLYLVEVFLVFNTLNYVHIFFTPYMLMGVILIAIIGYKVLTEEANVKFIRSTFSRFVSKDVVNELLANPEAMKLGGEKKEISVFFSDVRGFTTISESLEPEELVNLLNDYLSVMTDIILMYKGTIDKYMGDAIMAFWGAPVPNADHAYQSVVATLAQLKKLEELQESWKQKGWPIIKIGTGINSGQAVVGNMGSAHRMDYTLMGDTINLGSRLEGATKLYGIQCMISEFTYAMVKDRVYARELDLIRVKGKNEPVRVYELIDIIDQDDFERLKVKEL